MLRGKKIALVCGAVIGVLIALSFVLPMILETDKYTNYVAKKVGDKIDRDVSVEHLRVSVWGGLGVELRNLTVSNRKGFGEEALVKVARARVGVEALPLLKKRLEVKEVVLERPEILLERNGEGLYNFSDILLWAGKNRLTEGREETQPGKRAGGEPVSPPGWLAGAVLLPRLSMKDGALTFVDRQTRPGTKLVTQISDIDLKVDQASPDSPFNVELKGRAGKAEKQNLLVKGTVLPDKDGTGSATFDMKIEAADVGFSLVSPYLSSTLPFPMEGRNFSAALRIYGNTGKEIRGAGKFSIDGVRPTEGKGARADLKMEVAGEVIYNLQDGKVAMNPVRMTLGKTELEVSGSVVNRGPEPDLNLVVRSGSFDLDTMNLFYPSLEVLLPHDLRFAGKTAFSVNLRSSGGKMAARGTVDLSGASVGYSTYFEKAVKRPLKVDFQITTAGETVRIDTLNGDLGDLWFDVSGTVRIGMATELDLKFLTSPVSMDALKNLVPGLKDIPLKGRLRWEGTVRGPINEPQQLKFRIKPVLTQTG